MISTCACDLPQRRAPLRRSFFLSARFDGGCTLVPTLPAPEHRWATFLRGTRRDRFLIQIHNGAPGIFQIVPPHRGCPSNKRVSLSTVRLQRAMAPVGQSFPRAQRSRVRAESEVLLTWTSVVSTEVATVTIGVVTTTLPDKKMWTLSPTRTDSKKALQC